MTSEQESSAIAATLPLESRDTHPSHTAAVIQRTEPETSWFSAARSRDRELGFRLGSLNYLPPEIRLRIYHYIVRHYIGFYGPDCDRTIWLCTGDVKRFEGQRIRKKSTVIWGDRAWWGQGRLADFHLTSPTIKEEYDWWFLSTYEFGFANPLAYLDFINRLTIRQQSWIRRLRFEITSREPGPWDFSLSGGWMCICDELPTTLVSITLEIGQYYWGTKPENYICSWSSYSFMTTKEQNRKVRRAAEMLSMLRKRILRRIPGIQTKIAGHKYDELSQEHKATVDQAFDEDVDL